MSASITPPKYQQLANALRSHINAGELKAGDRLPSFAQMYREHGATVATMRRVYELLENEKLIERRGGSGVYVVEAKRALTGNIGLIANEDYYHNQTDYHKHLFHGIRKFTEQSGQHLMFMGNYPNLDPQSFKKVDGILISNVEYPQHQLKQLPSHLPRVSLFIKENQVTNVIADEYEGARTAVRYLLEQGHRRIACLMEKHLYVSQQRFAGYRNALEAAGIDLQPQWARLTEVANVGENPPTYLQWGRNNMREWLLQGWRETGCTAILAQNDAAAIGVLQALQEKGIDIPGDVSVMGFDGTELCDHVTPRLCSMKIPLEEMGYKAAEILHRQIHQEQREIQTLMLPMSLRAGDSVAAMK